MRLTPSEMHEMCDELNEVMGRWSEVGRVDPNLRPEDRPADGRETVFVFYHAFPEKP